jgi:hypothetical protein
MSDQTPRVPECEREGLTPIPDHRVLLIDCTVHGPVGVITMGEDEYGRAEREFSKHWPADAVKLGDTEALKAQIRNTLAEFEPVRHHAAYDTSGEPGECHDDCPGCITDALHPLLEPTIVEGETRA